MYLDLQIILLANIHSLQCFFLFPRFRYKNTCWLILSSQFPHQFLTTACQNGIFTSLDGVVMPFTAVFCSFEEDNAGCRAGPFGVGVAPDVAVADQELSSVLLDA